MSNSLKMLILYAYICTYYVTLNITANFNQLLSALITDWSYWFDFQTIEQVQRGISDFTTMFRSLKDTYCTNFRH